MVVGPYNDHVDLLIDTIAVTPGLGGVRVGTVDRFQGQEAPVVFFTMASSSGADMPRGLDFLFSVNVAISRTRALAYIVCTDELLDTPARSVADMRLIGTLPRVSSGRCLPPRRRTWPPRATSSRVALALPSARRWQLSTSRPACVGS